MDDPDCLPPLLSFCLCVSFFVPLFVAFFRVWTECEFPVWHLLVGQWKGYYCASFTFLYLSLLSSLPPRRLAAPCLVMARHVSYLFKCHLSGLSCAFYDNIFELYERENESTFVIFLFKPLRCPPSPFSLLLSSFSFAVSLPRSLSRAYKLSEVFHN